VRFEGGKPVKNATLEILGPPHEENVSWAVPIITPRVVGVIGSNAPPVVTSSYGFITVNGKGYFRLKGMKFSVLKEHGINPASQFYIKVGSETWVFFKPTPEKLQRAVDAPHACVPFFFKDGVMATLEIELRAQSKDMPPCW